MGSKRLRNVFRKLFVLFVRSDFFQFGLFQVGLQSELNNLVLALSLGLIFDWAYQVVTDRVQFSPTNCAKTIQLKVAMAKMSENQDYGCEHYKRKCKLVVFNFFFCQPFIEIHSLRTVFSFQWGIALNYFHAMLLSL